MVNKATAAKKLKLHHKSAGSSKQLFKQVIFTIVILTLLSGGTSFLLASQERLSPQQKLLLETSSVTWEMGIEATLGLLLGKATDLSHREEEQDK